MRVLTVRGSGFSVQDECEYIAGTGFGEQCSGDREGPAGAGGGGAEQHGAGRQGDAGIESDRLFEVLNMWCAGEIFGAWWS